jgi:hypothetical protein
MVEYERELMLEVMHDTGRNALTPDAVMDDRVRSAAVHHARDVL